MQDDFYKIKNMEDFTEEEWEAVCDGCGLCCLEKLLDEDTGELFFTRVACNNLDIETCRCKVYEKRFESRADCINLEFKDLGKIDYLPETCSYRFLYENKKLPPWHYLESGERDGVHNLGISARNNAVSGENIHPDDLEYFI